jgi:hypothetical protein
MRHDPSCASAPQCSLILAGTDCHKHIPTHYFWITMATEQTTRHYKHSPTFVLLWQRSSNKTAQNYFACWGNSYLYSSCDILKLKLKLYQYTPWRRLRERRYSSYSFMTSALYRAEWSASRPSRALAPGKGPPVPTGHEAGWDRSLDTEVRGKILLYLSWIEPRSPVCPVGHYTDWANPASRYFM